MEKNRLNCTMPATVKSRLGSSRGTSGAPGRTTWPRSRKNSRKALRISREDRTKGSRLLGLGCAGFGRRVFPGRLGVEQPQADAAHRFLAEAAAREEARQPAQASLP